MPSLVPELSWQSLTATINDIKSPQAFLKQLLFGRENTHPTEALEIGKWFAGRTMVPFVRKNAQAYPVAGVSKAFRMVEAPNIRVKTSFKPSPLLFGRTPGTKVFLADGENQISAVQQHIQMDMQHMADQITNRIEWMCAQALTGVITYSQDDTIEADAFEFDYNRTAGNTIVLAGAALWDSGTEDIADDVREAKRLVNDATGVRVTDAILGQDAASAFLASQKVRDILDRRNAEDDTPQILGGDFRPDGAYFLGRIFGINWWEYARELTDSGGTSAPLIAVDQAFFVSQEPAAGQSLEYAAIPDMDAFQDGLLQVKRFSKSWVEKDPSAVVALSHTRPFPLLRRPDSIVQMTVV